MRPPPLRQQTGASPFAARQGLLLGTRPPFDLPFCGDRIGDRLKMLGEDQRDWTTTFGIAAKYPRIVLSNAQLKFLARRANVVTTIRAAQNVQVCSDHRPPSPFETRSFGPLLRMRAEGSFSQSLQRLRLTSPSAGEARSWCVCAPATSICQQASAPWRADTAARWSASRASEKCAGYAR